MSEDPKANTTEWTIDGTACTRCHRRRNSTVLKQIKCRETSSSLQPRIRSCSTEEESTTKPSRDGAEWRDLRNPKLTSRQRPLPRPNLAIRWSRSALPANLARKVVRSVMCFEVLVRKPSVILVRFFGRENAFQKLVVGILVRENAPTRNSPAKWVRKLHWPFAGLAAPMRGRPQSAANELQPTLNLFVLLC